MPDYPILAVVTKSLASFSIFDQRCKNMINIYIHINTSTLRLLAIRGFGKCFAFA